MIGNPCSQRQHRRMNASTIEASAPGRICLFGEHQDYLGLPVVAMAIDLRFTIRFEEQLGAPDFLIETPDLPEGARRLDPDSAQPLFPGDFLWGAARVLVEEGFAFPRRGRVVMTSQIPVRAGCSSSSAMTAAFLRLLVEIGQHTDRKPYSAAAERMAYLTYRAEKVLFGGAGGMMDQYSCYLGGLIHVYPEDGPIPYSVESLTAAPNGFLLIDSGVPKDTQGVLRSAGSRARAAIALAEEAMPEFSIQRTRREELLAALQSGHAQLSEESAAITLDHLRNRDICQEGLTLLRAGLGEAAAQERLGQLLTEEHRILSETLGISTARIDSLVRSSIEAGALGAKINGSGGGGTAFCYAPGNMERVEARLQADGARTFRVRAAEGARLENRPA